MLTGYWDTSDNANVCSREFIRAHRGAHEPHVISVRPDLTEEAESKEESATRY